MKNININNSVTMAKLPKKRSITAPKYKDKRNIHIQAVKIAKNILTEHERAFEVLGNG